MKLFSQIARLVTHPAYSTLEEDRLARVFHQSALLVIGLTIVYCAILVFEERTTPFNQNQIIFALVVIFILLAGIWGVNQGYVRTTITLILIVGQITTIGAGYLFEGIREPTLHMIYVILIVTSVFVSDVAILLMGVSTVFLLSTLFYFDHAGYLTTGLTPPSLDTLILVNSAIITTTVILRLTVNQMAQKTNQIKKQAEILFEQKSALEKYQNHLQDLVAERTRELEETTHALAIAKNKAETASKAKSAFVANVSHELRTPLTAIIGYSEVIQEEIRLNIAPDLTDARRIESAGRHLLAMINDILDLSKIEANRMALQLERVYLDEQIEMLKDLMFTSLKSNNNTLIVNNRVNDLAFSGDPQKIRQILLNLLNNAAKFTQNGTITFSVDLEHSTEKPCLVFEIRDTGIGIDQAFLPYLFEPFTQEEQTTEHHVRHYAGSGLGLAISRRLCRLMGGDLTATSEKGLGSTFRASIAVDAVVFDATVG